LIMVISTPCWGKALPPGAFTMAELDQAKAKAVARNLPLVFIVTELDHH